MQEYGFIQMSMHGRPTATFLGLTRDSIKYMSEESKFEYCTKEEVVTNKNHN